MSYLHCPACSRAYNLATHPSCPCCAAVAVAPPIAAPIAPADNLVAAVEALVRAMAQATPAERAAAAVRIDQLAAPPAAIPAERPAAAVGPELLAAPASAVTDPHAFSAAEASSADPRDRRGHAGHAGHADPAPRSIRTALALTARRAISRPRPLLAAVAFAVLDRVAPHAPRRLLRAVHAGVQAFRGSAPDPGNTFAPP